VNGSEAALLETIDFARGDGLVPVVAQHAHTGEVLMLGYGNREALERSLQQRLLWFWSRSRGTLWMKGETSGNVLQIVSLHADCDGDAVLARVVPSGPTCHTGDRSCFAAAPTLTALDDVIAERARSGTGYTGRLLDDANLRLKKLGEEAIELALACTANDPGRVTEEAADLLYHVLVACRATGVNAAAVLAVLERRRSES
jgi:phosphoribosyl-AMP cyclohydrolase / phosphoribosyl-ATP pyrophosphohydrolase